MQGPSISSDNKLQFHCPKSWGELSQQQLRYVLTLLASGKYESIEIRTMMVMRFCGIKVLKKHTDGFWSCSVTLANGKKHLFDLQTWQVHDMAGQMQFIDKPEDMDIVLEDICGYHAVDKLLHGLVFIDYLNLEACYQGWIYTKSPERVEAMARILYRDNQGNLPENLKLNDAEVLGTLFWYYHIKTIFARQFDHFFKPVASMGKEYNFLDAVNAQIRALTDGDVTKNETIRLLDCWECLTELDAKAQEAEEFKKKYGNNKP